MTSTLLCATDLGSSGRRCATIAGSLGRALGADVELLFVGEPDALPAVDPVPPEIRPAAEELRRRVVARREAHRAALEQERTRLAETGVTCRAAFHEGRPWEEITAYAEATHPRLVIVGPHGDATRDLWLDGLRARLLGGTADRVVRHARQPVLVAPMHDNETPEGPIVVGIDLSDVSEWAAREAAEIAAATKRRLVLVHALPETTDENGAAHADYAALLQDHAEREARRHLGAVAARIGGDPELMVAPIEDTPAETLLAVAAERGASWVTLGTHGRTGLARWVLGSTAERILRRTDRPVLVVPHPRGQGEGAQT